MAQIDDGGGDGRSKTVDLNLVPIIDLMSVCIIFLLLTAVWTQVSMIQIGSSVYAKKSTDQVELPPKVEIPFRLDVTESGYRVLFGKQELQFPKVDGRYDQERLTVQLKKLKELYPDKTDAVITVQDQLSYETLIGGMDALIVSGFPNVAIATEAAAP